MTGVEKQAYELCLAIEQLPASEYQTKLAIMASDLLQNIRAAQPTLALDGATVAEFCDCGISIESHTGVYCSFRPATKA